MSAENIHKIHVTRKKGINNPEIMNHKMENEVPIMEVFKKIEQLTTESDQDELPDTLRIVFPFRVHFRSRIPGSFPVPNPGIRDQFYLKNSREFPRTLDKFSIV